MNRSRFGAAEAASYVRFFALTAALLVPATTARAQPVVPGEPLLKATTHPRLPAELWQFWLAPASGASSTVAMNELATAVKLEVDGDFAKALPILVEPAVQQGTLGHYAQ